MNKNLVILSTFVFLLLLGACSKETRTADELWKSGTALYEVGNFEGAVDLYSRIVDNYPENELALKADFSIADIYKNNIKDYDKAIKHYKIIENKYPNSEKTPNALFMIGYIFANEVKDMQKAKEAYNYFIKQYPDHVLVQSAKWELENLGKSLEEIQQAANTETETK